MKRILVVDDDPTSRYTMSRILGDCGFEVYAAADYLGALNALEKQPVDLLLTDIVMPKGINGFALGRMAQMRHKNLKVLYVTGYDVAVEETPVLRKPLTDAALIEHVTQALAA